MSDIRLRCSTERDPRWAAVLARDAKAYGDFVYAVKTTGVYCHQGSPSRLPKPENVEFFDTEAAAQAAGLSSQPTLRRSSGGAGCPRSPKRIDILKRLRSRPP